MRTILLFAVIGLCCGCSKKSAKHTAPSKDEVASATPQQPPPAPNNTNNKKGNKADGANWLNDPRFKKDQPEPGAPPEGAGATGKVPWGLAPPQGGWQAPATGVQPAPGAGPMSAPGVPVPPGMGLVQPNPNPPPAPGGGTPLGAGNKAVTMADMKEVWTYIENRSGASGKMPTQVEIYMALIQAKSLAADLVKDGAITLTGATTREGVWAFEARAATNGGLVVTQNGVETLTAAELKARLGK